MATRGTTGMTIGDECVTCHGRAHSFSINGFWEISPAMQKAIRRGDPLFRHYGEPFHACNRSIDESGSRQPTSNQDEFRRPSQSPHCHVPGRSLSAASFHFTPLERTFKGRAKKCFHPGRLCSPSADEAVRLWGEWTYGRGLESHCRCRRRTEVTHHQTRVDKTPQQRSLSIYGAESIDDLHACIAL